VASARNLARSAASRLAELGTRDAPLLAAQLTCAALLLAPIGGWTVRPLTLTLAAAGLLAPAVAASAGYWALLAVLAGLRVLLDWPLSDNHGYLLAIWCSALAVSFAGPRPRRILAGNARLLVGLAFALATLQKAWIAPDYLDGTFFRWVFAVDPRFEDLGALLGRSGADLERTRAWLEAAPGAAPPDAAFVETAALRAAAGVFTAATLLLEGAVALLFLAPPALGLGRARDAALLFFCAATYAIAPVAGFGWLLLAMGVAQSEWPRARWGYLAVFALLVVYREVPVLGWATGFD
jgi:hypothetical protein